MIARPATLELTTRYRVLLCDTNIMIKINRSTEKYLSKKEEEKTNILSILRIESIKSLIEMRIIIMFD